MHTAGSWRVNEGTDSAVLAALYLRSALGARPDSGRVAAAA